LATAGLLLKTWPGTRFSSVYRSTAREYEEQEDFLNAVALIETMQNPEEVLRILVEIERALGKNLPFRFGPRTIDLDLLLYDNRVLESSTLILPHPRMHERRFVLEPLCELIDPEEQHPRLAVSWRELLDETAEQRCECITLRLEKSS